MALVRPAFPSVTATSLIEIVGTASSLVMVAVATLGVETSAKVAPVRLTVNVSLPSSLVSPFTCTVNVAVVLPAGIVTDPEATWT